MSKHGAYFVRAATTCSSASTGSNATPFHMRPGPPSRRCSPTTPLRTWNVVHSAMPIRRSSSVTCSRPALRGIQVETVALTTRVSARHAAQGLVLGSPFRSEIERRDSSSLDRALDAVTAALARWDGNDAPMSAHVVTAGR